MELVVRIFNSIVVTVQAHKVSGIHLGRLRGLNNCCSTSAEAA